ncbi:hypothetical protein T01_5044 [Trichinella spiralis]|uniref:Uncharacterized protein n=1 Tax=Trichinella spiralis TaxID=6334 RepID=A0A0V1BTA9_TRISP|nr:hypothetical protein T01_5044 [Trichinella spiralis]
MVLIAVSILSSKSFFICPDSHILPLLKNNCTAHIKKHVVKACYLLKLILRSYITAIIFCKRKTSIMQEFEIKNIGFKICNAAALGYFWTNIVELHYFDDKNKYCIRSNHTGNT